MDICALFCNFVFMESVESAINARKLWDARERFASLLDTNASEKDWQLFFSECPYVLSESLPLRLQPSDITPLGRPGKNEADFMFHPKKEKSPSFYGIVELKKPDSKLLSIPRKNVLRLSSDAQTAFAQSKFYLEQLEKEFI